MLYRLVRINCVFQFLDGFEVAVTPAEVGRDFRGLAHFQEGIELQDFGLFDFIDAAAYAEIFYQIRGGECNRKAAGKSGGPGSG